MENPYRGKEGQEWYARAWDEGHAYGLEHPAEDNPRPPGFYPPFALDARQTAWMDQVWSEAALEARESRKKFTPATPKTPGEVAAHAAPELAHLVYEAAHTALVPGATVVGGIGAGAIGVFVLLIGATEPSERTLAEEELQQWFARAASESGHNEFFVACVWPDGYQVAGWYGALRGDYNTAFNDALTFDQHKPGEALSIAHYRADSPGLLEIIHLQRA